MLEAVFGHEYENYLDVYSQYELDLSFGLFLVPFLSEILYKVVKDYRFKAGQQQEQKCEVPHNTLERLIDLAIAIGWFTWDRGCTGEAMDNRVSVWLPRLLIWGTSGYWSQTVVGFPYLCEFNVPWSPPVQSRGSCKDS